MPKPKTTPKTTKADTESKKKKNPKKIQVPRSYFAAATLVFLIFILANYLVAETSPQSAEQVTGELVDTYGFIKDLSNFEIFIFILVNNGLKSLLVVFSGLIFALPPLAFLAINGAVLGTIISFVSSQIGLVKTLIALIPHGLLEIPAVLLAGGYGIWLGGRVVKKIHRGAPLKPYLKFAGRQFFRIILPLLLIAALVEAFLTPYLVGKVS